MNPEHYLEDVVLQFKKLKELAEKAVSKVTEADLMARLDEESNSILVILKHIAGNLRSRWTDFLTTDGEKPDRRRDAEFELEKGETKESILERWEAGWRCLFKALENLQAEDLQKTVFIRGERHSVPEAIHRQLTHQAYHVGQIVLLAKHFGASRWKSLSVPRGKSEEFNAEMKKKSGKL